MATICNDVEACIDQVISQVGKEITFGLPLGLAKPTHMINALYRRAKKDPSIQLKIITAISLEKPSPKSDLESRLLTPFIERVFGGVPDLEYAVDQTRNQLPENVTVTEFYFKPASYLNHKVAQQNYISTNYTHAPRDLVDFGINVIAQSIAKRELNGHTTYSLSSNSDIFLDLVPLLKERREQREKVLVLGQVNSQMPYMVNDAEVCQSEFDMILEDETLNHRLFSTPNMAITPTDHMIGLHASTLLKDGGTLQIGIGSLGDALINATLMRHQRNSDYCELLDDLNLSERFPVINEHGGRGTFQEGLYGNTEMLVHGYMSLYHAGILKRKVYDHLTIQQLVNEGVLQEKVKEQNLIELIERRAISAVLTEEDVSLLKRFGLFKKDVQWCNGQLHLAGQQYDVDLSNSDNFDRVSADCLGDKLTGGIVLHGAFFLGPEDFYQGLRDLTEEQRREINMTAVSYTNGLYGEMDLKNAQRRHARYVNTCMKMSLLGSAASDALENGQVVSGVGGQYNFVAMAHEQPDARSILLLKSTRQTKGGLESNIVFNYGYTTIPRHLRDIVITEYGIADLRGKSDNVVMQQLIQVADSRFQDDLVRQAKASGKLDANYEIPSQYCNNLPAVISETIAKYRKRGCFEAFPFSCNFTAEELALGKALKGLKAKSSNKLALLKTLLEGWTMPEIPEGSQLLLARMGLDQPSSFKQKLVQRLILGQLHAGESNPTRTRIAGSKPIHFRRRARH